MVKFPFSPSLAFPSSEYWLGGLYCVFRPGIFATEIDDHEDGEPHRQGLEGQQHRETGDVPQQVLGQEEIGRKGVAQVAQADVHGDTKHRA